MAPIRVVLDTNVFGKDHFDALDRSPVRRLCRSGRVTLIYGDVFLEEIAQAYMAQSARLDLVQRWLPFVAETTDRLCRNLSDIWNEELVQGRGPNASIFMSKEEQQNVLSHFASIPLDGSWSLVAETKVARDRVKAKKQAQRKLSLEMREEVLRRLRQRKGVRAEPGLVALGEKVRGEITQFIGQEMIRKYVRPKDPIPIISHWLRDQHRFPYFTQFAANIAFKEAHFMTQADAQVDFNAQADLDVMTHLLRADILVTNEKGFMRSAFDYLWRPRKKVLFTSDEFVGYLERLASN